MAGARADLAPAAAAAIRALAQHRRFHISMAGLATGLALAPASPAFALAAAGCLAGALALLRLGTLATLAASLLLAGVGLGDARLAAIDAPAAGVREGAPVAARAHLLTAPRPSAFGSSAEVRLLTGRSRGARLLARAPRSLRWPGGGRPGLELAVRGSLRRLQPRHGPGFDFAAHLRRRGVAGELLLDRLWATGRRRGGAAGLIERLRARAGRSLGSGLPPPEAALARGMVLGEDEAIGGPVRDDFRASGLGHLLAVSGQNVMLLGALALPPLAAAGFGPRTRGALLLALIGLYVPLAGAGPSLQRAGVMGAAGVVALSASRPASRSYALLLAAAVTLALNPRATADPGWQLSFAAVAGIIWLAPSLRRVLGALPGPAAEGIAITVAATIATAPLIAHHFGSLPLVSLPANLLALPAVAPAMWLGMIKVALGLPATPEGVARPFTELLGVADRPLLAYLGWLAERFADLPGGTVALPLGSVAGVLAAYALLLAGAVATGVAARRLQGPAAEWAAAWRRLPGARRAGILTAGVALLALLAHRALAPPGPPGSLTISFLDVGQGDATLIQDAHGTAVLFDGGPPEARVARLLRRAGVRRLAVVVATHASRDHHGGLKEVLERYPVRLLLDGGDGTRDPTFRAVEAAASERGVRRLGANAPLHLGVGALDIRVLSPSPRPPGPPPEDPNPRAVVAVVSSGGFDLLLSADAESEALLPLSLPHVEAMKVPHHGSSDPGLPQVLARLRPEVAAIEVGSHNPYGHPAPSTLGALRRAHVRTYRTDRDGTVRLTVDHGAMMVEREG